MTKIIVAGIGGVSGYFGGLLAHQNAGSLIVEVDFVARGEHLQAIQNHGLKVIKGEKNWIAKPYLATADPAEIGIADYILICTKNYDLIEILQLLNPAIGPNTVLLPLLNGVEAVEKVRTQFPNHLVPAGCAYIVSSIKAPGIVENIGTLQKIYFGLTNESDTRLEELEMILKQAGIDATLSTDISTVIWEKFIFLSCIATATSYFNQAIGQV